MKLIRRCVELGGGDPDGLSEILVNFTFGMEPPDVENTPIF